MDWPTLTASRSGPPKGKYSPSRAAQPTEQAQLPAIVDPQLLEGTTVNFPRSLVRLAWILQHAVTLLPMAGDIQAVINSQTAGVSDIHAWGLMLPSSSGVSPITYHSVVAVRYPDLCRLINSAWELGSFASGGIPSRPPGFQFVLWDTNARINGLVAVDGWRLHPTLVIPANLPSTKEAPVCDVEAPAHSTASTEPPRSPEGETHNILATAAKNQAEDPSSSQHMKPPRSIRNAAAAACNIA